MEEECESKEEDAVEWSDDAPGDMGTHAADTDTDADTDDDSLCRRWRRLHCCCHSWCCWTNCVCMLWRSKEERRLRR